MLSFIFAVILLVIAVIAAVARKTYVVVPAHELKRQAATGNQLARRLYRSVGHGASLNVLLWLVLALSAAAGFVLLARTLAPLLAVLVVAITLWLAFSWLPGTRVSSLSIKITGAITPLIDKALNYVDPILLRVSGFFGKHYVRQHSGLYELNDLLDLLDLQSNQPDSRITGEEINLVRHVLQFGDRTVRDVLRPAAKVKTIALTDAVGPILLDELHASGQPAFPVKKSPRSKDIVGYLQLGDLDIHSKGTVQDHVSEGVTYVHEGDSLAEALHVYFASRSPLMVVIDSFEEYVGVLLLDDILMTLVGQPQSPVDLGNHTDRAQVASRHGVAVAPADPADDALPESEPSVVE